MGNPLDLIKINMSEIPRCCFFISNHHINRGTMFKIEDGKFKRELYNFIEKYPDRVLRGEK